MIAYLGVTPLFASEFAVPGRSVHVQVVPLDFRNARPVALSTSDGLVW